MSESLELDRLKKRAIKTLQHVIDNTHDIKTIGEINISNDGRKNEVQIISTQLLEKDAKHFNLLGAILSNAGIKYTQAKTNKTSDTIYIPLEQDGIEDTLNILNKNIKAVAKNTPAINDAEIKQHTDIEPMNTNYRSTNIAGSDIEKKAKTILQYVLDNGEDKGITVSTAANVAGLYISDDSKNSNELLVKCCSSGTADTKQLRKIYNRELLPLKNMLRDNDIIYKTEPHLERDNKIIIPLDQEGLSEKLDMLKNSVSERVKTNEADAKITGGSDSEKLVQSPVLARVI